MYVYTRIHLYLSWLTVFGSSQVTIPFRSFTDYWDDATGEPIKACATNPEYCPDAATLQDMRTISFWAEGKLGTVALEVQGIDAVGCKAEEDGRLSVA